MPLNFVKSNRGKNHLVHEGYRYILDKQTAVSNLWSCIKLRHEKCRARLVTADNEIVKISNDHNHTPDATEIEVKVIRSEMKAAAQTTSHQPALIVAQCTQQISECATVRLPSPRTLKRTIRKERVKSNNCQPVPTSLLTLSIPDNYTRTAKNEMFLLYDSGPAFDRILLFGTMSNIQHMKDSPHWYADGTFKVAPELFDQLYTIHVVRYNKVFPAVFALLPNRKETTYVKMLTAIKNLDPALSPRSIMTNFEKAAKNAFKVVFPEAIQNGCLFHFGQCIYRRIQQLPELAKNYIAYPDFALRVRCLGALAFVPPNEVKRKFEELISDEFYSHSAEMESLVDYVEDNWIGGYRRGKDKPPRFEIQEWNCFNRVMDDMARTNNAVEGWHRGFQSLLGASHPSLWRLIEIFKQEQSLNELQINQNLNGEVPQPQRRTYRNLSNRLKTIVEGYNSTVGIEYLTGVAHCLKLNV